MTELNQNPMNTDQRSKTPLVLFIVCILVLAIVGGYFAYAKSLNKTADVAQTNEVNGSVENNAAQPSTTADNQVPVDWKEYTLTSCGITIQAPKDWEIKGDNFIELNSYQTAQFIKNKDYYEGMADLVIDCQQSVEDNIRNTWNKYNSQPADLDTLEGLKNTLSFQIDQQAPTTRVFGLISTIEISTFGKNKGIHGIFEGFGDTYEVYLFNPRNDLIQISTLNIDQSSAEIDFTSELKPPTREPEAPIKEIIDSISFIK